MCREAENIHRHKQQIAIVDVAGWEAPGDTSGTLGLAYPDLGAAFSGTDPSTYEPETQIVYDPVFTSLWKAKKIDPLFSVALSRGAQGSGQNSQNTPDGYLALGGLPPVPMQGKWAIAPLEYVTPANYYLQGVNPWPQFRMSPISCHTPAASQVSFFTKMKI